MEERISKLLALAGIASRRESDRVVQEGRVTVNGTVVTEPGHRVDPGRDHIKVDGKLLHTGPSAYLIINKPRGVLSTRQGDDTRPTVTSLMRGFKGRLLPVGRLEHDDEGVMLLTSDGDLAVALNNPKHGLTRVYLVKVRGVPDDRSLLRMRNGVPLVGGRSLPMTVSVVSVTGRNAWLQVSTREGRTRLLELMLLKLKHPLLKLKRLALGPLQVKGLAPGTFRKLTEQEVAALKTLAAQPPGLPEPVYLNPEQEDEALQAIVAQREDRKAARASQAPRAKVARSARPPAAPPRGGREGRGAPAATVGPRAGRPGRSRTASKPTGRLKRNHVERARSRG